MAIGLQRRPGAPLETRYVDFVYQPNIEPDGSISGVFVDGNDVTDRTVAEEALREADRHKDEFLATLAHELHNPLAPIRYACKIAKAAPAQSAQLTWANDVIDRQVEHMSHLLEDLLDVSRISLGRLKLRKQRVLIGDSIRAATSRRARSSPPATCAWRSTSTAPNRSSSTPIRSGSNRSCRTC